MTMATKAVIWMTIIATTRRNGFVVGRAVILHLPAAL
jgi:hypothetical protein